MASTTTPNELNAAFAPLERLVAELESRLRAQEKRASDVRLLLLARGQLSAERR